MDKAIEIAAASYKTAQAQGQLLLSQRWVALLESTKSALMDSGFYSESGKRLEITSARSNAPQHDCERLEYAIGVLRQCVGAKLPQRTEKGAPIPVEAVTDEVPLAVSDLLSVREWHDPVLLRLALYAVCMHQKANALSFVGPPSSESLPLGCAVGALKLALLLAMPVSLAAGIAGALRQDVVGASLAFYVFGAGVLACLAWSDRGDKKATGFELAYNSWTTLQIEGFGGGAGAGALEQLRRMASDGVKVPASAFDLAEMLRLRMGIKELSDAVKERLPTSE